MTPRGTSYVRVATAPATQDVPVAPHSPRVLHRRVGVGLARTGGVSSHELRNHAYILQNTDRRVIFASPYEHRFTLIGNSRITGVPKSLGNLLTTTYTTPALTMDSNAAISGNVSFLNPAATYTMNSNATIADQSTPAEVAKHIETVAEEFVTMREPVR